MDGPSPTLDVSFSSSEISLVLPEIKEGTDLTTLIFCDSTIEMLGENAET
jgi:hypothetical protein